MAIQRCQYTLKLECTDNVEWLHLLYQFTTVQTLHISHELVGYVALALEDIDSEIVAETPPPLDLIYLADQPASSIEKFRVLRLQIRECKTSFAFSIDCCSTISPPCHVEVIRHADEYVSFTDHLSFAHYIVTIHT